MKLTCQLTGLWAQVPDDCGILAQCKRGITLGWIISVFGHKATIVPPSRHRNALGWQRHRGLIERNKIPLPQPHWDIRAVNVSVPWCHVRSSLFTSSPQGCFGERHIQWDRKRRTEEEREKVLSAKHCDSFLIVSPTSPLPPSTSLLSSLLSSHHISAENEIRCATKTDDPL